MEGSPRGGEVPGEGKSLAGSPLAGLNALELPTLSTMGGSLTCGRWFCGEVARLTPSSTGHSRPLGKFMSLAFVLTSCPFNALAKKLVFRWLLPRLQPGIHLTRLSWNGPLKGDSA